jgi:hypothetical protein
MGFVTILRYLMNAGTNCILVVQKRIEIMSFKVLLFLKMLVELNLLIPSIFIYGPCCSVFSLPRIAIIGSSQPFGHIGRSGEDGSRDSIPPRHAYLLLGFDECR